MIHSLVLVLSLLGLLNNGASQIIQSGQCNLDSQLQENFEIERIIGDWHELERSDNDFHGGDCSEVKISQRANGIIDLYVSGINENFYEDFSGILSTENSTSKIVFESSTPSRRVELSVLLTDYSNFLVLFSCDEVSTTQRSVNIWVLGKQRRHINDLIPARISTELNATLGVTLQDLRAIDHSDDACYILPVIQPGQPVVLTGACDQNIQVTQNFDINKYAGLWHEIYAYESDSSENKCSRSEYSRDENGTILIENSQVLNQNLTSVSGTVTPNTDGSAKLTVQLNLSTGARTQDVWILETDYDRFSVVYSCENLDNNRRRVYSWILSRTRRLTEETKAAIDKVVDRELFLNYRYYKQTDQSDDACFFYPDPEPGKPVVFRGQCNENITVQQNFDAVRYTGIWHDIESYPSVFQTGACRNANYRLEGGSVAVLNTQVINETLLSLDGVAVLVDGNNGKLEVTFPIEGTNFTTTTSYWVLETDYTSYSLVYTCVNINEDEKQVWSWKLSRRKELDENATIAINNVLSNIPELDQRYFQPVDQSVDGCFYYPEPKQGQPVVFPGQCDETILVEQNFNLSRFIGTWYEYESYPKDQAQGQCISHEYTAGVGNTLSLQTTQIIDQFLNLSNGTFEFQSNETSAKMNIRITVNGEDINIPFWILGTDYDNYALAYSCVNRDEDFRAVYSWKLGKSKQLENASLSEISNIIENIDVLSEEYYEPIDQSEEACFYLPEIPARDAIILPGQCDPNIPVMQNFNATAYLGEWRLIESYGTDFQDGECNTAEYTGLDDGTVDVYNTQVIDVALDTIRGSARLASNDGSGKLLVTFPNSQMESDYWILSTDYDSYALVYSCRNINAEQRRVWSWKLSRTRSLSQKATDEINEVVNSVNVLNNRYYYTIDQTDEGCFYFPEPNGQAVVFRGQCDESIPAFPNFNVARYLGLWYNIELYPSAFILGTCSNADYSLGTDGVVVYNTEVVNQTLSTITGQAVVASTDGSAKLEVDFGFGSTTPYWVLGTDYDFYSLVYTCINLDDDRRQVTTWKLSRFKYLDSQSSAAIDLIINRTQVLDNRYYESVNQTPSGCFFYPEPTNNPVEFPGQCSDSTVNVVQDFNLTRFEGTWYEIETYPKEQQQGECISHDYTTGTGNTLNLESSQVYGLTLGVTRGSLSFTSNDSSAEMLIQITANGTQIEFPFWIVATDYDDYALAYSCVNIDADYRRVFSWKLSRTRGSLSANATTAINDATSEVDVLRQEYYKNVDQSDEACFYLPDLEPNQPVVLPGQCDPNITVVQNFNASAYVGKWRLIETYATEFQDGECNRAEYTALDDGTVDVFNTQVVDEALVTIRGSARLASNDGSGKLLVSFPSTTIESDYWVLSTDYDSYALVYSCRNINSEQRRVWSWKLSRTSNLTQQATDEINEVINSVNVLDARYYNPVDQTDEGCFYFPEPSNQVVIFPGQCDENITVMPNFNAERYLGLWHNIELYPSAFILGTCSNAYYSLGADGVVVFNTEVVNQTLSTITGLAVVASTDGSAKLEVDFGFGSTTPYWVLETDYTSYSLVYTCVNLDDERRQVTTWKLSRFKYLETNASVAIDKVIDSVQVLDKRYYRIEDQTRNGCFYYPEPTDKPVEFPGQCSDSTVNVVRNFNLSRFEGTWYEIETYPKEQQQGECISHDYTTGTGNTLNLESSQVYGLTLGVTRGSLSFTSNDSSAEMLIQIAANGTQIEFPFWIVATDYDDYALAYSCVNIDADYRRVFSWKLSRTRGSLSANATSAINDATSEVDVLRQEYYKNVDQSDEACFYLPDLGSNEPVTFPGQCDPNIPVVQNFNASKYVGKWRLIETYATEFQIGECHRAEYTALDDGTVDVFNTQVINESLDTIRGSARLASSDGSGKLLVTFPNTTGEADYWILNTDYDSYALVYSCRNINSEQRRVWSWKLSRTGSLSQNATDAINEVVNRINVLDAKYYDTVDQTDDACFYYPVPNDEPVIFRGQCDENIPVEPNFNASRYAGVWYDIESYPVAFQDGTCPTAEYTINENGAVDVFNTQVVNQQLDTINGIAVVTSTDGTAKLEVTFPIAGTPFNVTTPYWVLSTDYDNYALVYSCSNVDAESRRVSSWKLSRTKSLSQQSADNIANASNVQVLRQDYYKVRGHDDESCFFYPDNNGGPVILDGQCEPASQVNAVTDFNRTRYAGIWYQHARFPSELQLGECTRNNYTSTQNGFNLEHITVYNERLETALGVVTQPTDGIGVFQLNRENFNENLYVLDTDYDEFSLLYICRNINNNQKQIYSWLYSRTQGQLSAEAEERINANVTAQENLFQGYYVTTAHDDKACFHYPVFEDPQAPIILPGPCNTTIRGISNFTTNEFFSGRWYEIERYPQQDQVQGTCNQIFYTNVPQSNNFYLSSRYVIDRTLNVNTGTVVPATDNTGSFTINYDDATPSVTQYVLATDYTDYALIYQCENLEGNQRQVTSWKLSRSTTLSNAAKTAFEDVVSKTEGLLEDYYNPTSQTDEDCFYVPTFNPYETPQFRGRCENITGVQNFDLNRYLGWWHEIERYPSDYNVGECRSTRYQSEQNQVQFVDTSVYEQTGQLTSGTVAVGTDGKLIRTLGNGQQQELWVLVTDYDNYSLLFSCETVDDEFIRVWSAKYSKIRTLSQQAQEAMAPIITASDLLYDDFYIKVNQSDSTCFYYPEPNGLSVTLPGQCDTNIATEQGFDVGAYTGSWYQIERYPYPQVPAEATCIGARYTLNEATNTVTVLNWQVLGEDQELEEIEGTATPSSDGSGKLSVTLPVVGTNDTTTTDLYILATDYVTYSLAYTCRNINSFERNVVAFKLSRTRSMPAEGTTAIDAVISRKEELHQPFFIPVTHYDDCKEPNTSNLVKSSIMIILVCFALQLFM